MSNNTTNIRLFVLTGILVLLTVALYFRLPALKRFIAEKQLESAMQKKQEKSYLEPEKIAENITITAENLSKAAVDEDEYVRQLVVFREDITPEILQTMAEDNSEYIRRQVASHPKTTAETLSVLAKDSDTFTRQLVVRNPNASQEILQNLVKDSTVQVQWEVAHNKNISPEILKKLADTTHFDLVKLQLSKNPTTPKETLEQLTKDKNKDVQKAAQEAIKTK